MGNIKETIVDISYILMYFVFFLGIPALVTFIANIFLKRIIRNKKIRIIVNCLIFIILVILLIAPGVYFKR